MVFKSLSRTKEYQRLPLNIQVMVQTTAGASHILALIAVNLVGYGVGVGGLQHLVLKLSSREGMLVLAAAYYFLLTGVSFMLFLRRTGWSRP